MTDIRELNLRRIELRNRLDDLGIMNQQTEPEARLKQDAGYALIRDAWLKAETDYMNAIANASPADLMEIANPAFPE